eukprot:GHRR01023413.1.p1 GENE.GHRR01023413.1~~GHRR01023413.1.p1  ORF type:complete len:110 (-),score=10.43 GHRR01023413.1:85-414(-)
MPDCKLAVLFTVLLPAAAHHPALPALLDSLCDLLEFRQWHGKPGGPVTQARDGNSPTDWLSRAVNAIFRGCSTVAVGRTPSVGASMDSAGVVILTYALYCTSGADCFHC